MGSVAYNPPEGKDYKWYISGIFPANWGMDYATHHVLGEPETTIEFTSSSQFPPVREFITGLIFLEKSIHCGERIDGYPLPKADDLFSGP